MNAMERVREVIKIDAIKKEEKLLRVAAYARVSTDKEAQLNSLSNQVSYYNRYIQSKRNWLFAGVYYDEGISGTKNDRDGFNRLIRDALDGKIDLIITKSISRFARNTLTILQLTRELAKMNVNVYFEEEHIYSISSKGELILTLLASVAQEQARSVSENCKWRNRREMQKGIGTSLVEPYGYNIKNKRHVINECERRVVERIFQMCRDGYGGVKILKQLNGEGIMNRQGKQWTYTTITDMLINPVYMGDMVLQKRFSEDYLSKRLVRNIGQKNKYIVEENHEGIITKEEFNEVQRIRASRWDKEHLKPNKPVHAFSKLIVCGYCGRAYKFKKSKYREYWSCMTYENLGVDVCSAKSIRDDDLKRVIVQALSIEKFDEVEMRKVVKKIKVFANDRKLEIEYKNGEVKEVEYTPRGRSEYWTDEKKEEMSILIRRLNGKSSSNTIND